MLKNLFFGFITSLFLLSCNSNVRLFYDNKYKVPVPLWEFDSDEHADDYVIYVNDLIVIISSFKENDKIDIYDPFTNEYFQNGNLVCEEEFKLKYNVCNILNIRNNYEIVIKINGKKRIVKRDYFLKYKYLIIQFDSDNNTYYTEFTNKRRYKTTSPIPQSSTSWN